jgi:epoxyqueuosine reductase
MRCVYSKFMWTAAVVKEIAHECGFELVGIATAGPVADFARYRNWVDASYAGEMRYLTDHRAEVRRDVRELLPSARSVICVGKLYNTPEPPQREGDAKISRYAWGSGDYHDVLREGLERVVEQLRSHGEFYYKICVDTAPLLERSLARDAGLGWIGRNTCLINEPQGSWFFLGEIVTSLELEPDGPPKGRCGTCTACIEACPTQAIVPQGDGWTIDSRKCISYLTIELRGDIPQEMHAGIGDNVYGCDICQDVCPWNRKAPVTDEAAFQPQPVRLDELVAMTPERFRERFRKSPVARTKHAGVLRNAAIVTANGAE